MSRAWPGLAIALWMAAGCATEVELSAPCLEGGVAEPPPEAPPVLGVGASAEVLVATTGERQPDALAYSGGRWMSVRAYPDGLAVQPLSLSDPGSTVAAHHGLERLSTAPAQLVPFHGHFLASVRPFLLQLEGTNRLGQQRSSVGQITHLLPWGTDDALARARTCTCCPLTCACEYAVITGSEATVETPGLRCDTDLALFDSLSSGGSPFDAIDGAIALATYDGAVLYARRSSGGLQIGIDRFAADAEGSRVETITPRDDVHRVVEVAVAAEEQTGAVVWRERPSADGPCALRGVPVALSSFTLGPEWSIEHECGRGLHVFRLGSKTVALYGTGPSDAGGIVEVASGVAPALAPLPLRDGAPCEPTVAAADGPQILFVCEGAGGHRIEDASRSLATIRTPISTTTEAAPTLGTAMHAACGAERCLVVYEERGDGRALRLRRPDGAVLDSSPIPLGPCRGPVASDGRSFLVACDRGALRLRDRDPQTVPLPTEAPITQLIFRDGAYLLLTLEQSRPRLWRLHPSTSSRPRPTGCCGDHPPVASDARLMDSAEGPVLVWTSERGRGLHATVLAPSGCSVRRQITLTAAAPLSRDAAAFGRTLLAIADRATYRADLRTGAVTEIDPLPGQALHGIEHGYFVVSPSLRRTTAGPIDLVRVALDGTPSTSSVQTTTRTRGTYALFAVAPNRLVLLFGSPLHLKTIEYR